MSFPLVQFIEWLGLSGRDLTAGIGLALGSLFAITVPRRKGRG